MWRASRKRPPSDGPCLGRHRRPFPFADCVTPGCTHRVHPAHVCDVCGLPFMEHPPRLLSDGVTVAYGACCSIPVLDGTGSRTALQPLTKQGVQANVSPQGGATTGPRCEKCAFEASDLTSLLQHRRGHLSPEERAALATVAEEELDNRVAQFAALLRETETGRRVPGSESAWNRATLRCGFGWDLVPDSGSIYEPLPGYHDSGCDFVAKSQRGLSLHHRKHRLDRTPAPAGPVAPPDHPRD